MVTEKDLIKLQSAARPVQEYLRDKGFCNCHYQAIVTLEGVRIVEDIEGVPFEWEPAEQEVE